MKRPSLPLQDLIQTLDWTDTKFHIAQRSDTGVQPLDEFTRDFDHWRDYWTGGYNSKKVWNKSYVFMTEKWRLGCESQLLIRGDASNG